MMALIHKLDRRLMLAENLAGTHELQTTNGAWVKMKNHSERDCLGEIFTDERLFYVIYGNLVS